ncbi:MAG: superoxide dismutase family protein [Chloroflexota bacterium]
MTSTNRIAAALLLPVMIAGVAFAASPAQADTTTIQGAKAELRNAQGQPVGTAIFSPVPQGLKLQVNVQGFIETAPGDHGIHVHAVGKCEAPSFTTAGGHFNPDAKKHGLNSPEGHHAGDMPNIIIDAAGNSTYETVLTNLTVDGGTNSVLDADGSAVVIHAGPDDLMTDPAGNSGARVACGEVATYAIPTAGMPRTGAGDGQTDFLPWVALVSGLTLLVAGKRVSSLVRSKQ